ncbi:MAG: AAA domain-containing protein [Actinomycetota bacterium]
MSFTDETTGAPVPDPARVAKSVAAAKAWTGQLVDVSGRNTLLFYKDQRISTLDLSDGSEAEPVAVEALLGSSSVRLSHLFPDPAALPRAAKRARTISAKAKENFEERGLQTLFVAWGMVTWTNSRGTATPQAPVLLRQAAFTARGGAAEDFDITLPGEWEINPTLLHLLRTEFQVTVSADELLDLLDDPGGRAPDAGALFEHLSKACSAVPGFGVAGRVVVGNFSYAKLPMVADIEAAAESGILASNDLLAAIAGDETARAAVRSRHPDVSIDLPDLVPLADEFLVLDADASQSYVINAVVAGGDLVIEGPPGTGKSQTIANLIATLAARHKKVLFVAEKRAAIDAVVERLKRVGLGNLVLDLHDGAGSRRQLAQDLERAMAEHAAVALPDLAAEQNRLVRRRETLSTRARALHRPRAPWGISVYDAQARLLGLPSQGTATARLRGPVLEALDQAASSAAAEELRDYVELGGLTIHRGEGGPWSAAAANGTITSAEQAAAARDALATLATTTLPGTLSRLRAAAAGCGLAVPDTLDGWRELVALLGDVATILSGCHTEIWTAPLDQLATDLEPATRGAFGRFGARLGNGAYRRALKQARALWREGKPSPSDTLSRIRIARAWLDAWTSRAVDGGQPRLPENLDGLRGAFDQLAADLAAVATVTRDGALLDPGGVPTGTLADRLDAFLADSTLYKLAELYRLRTALEQRGLGELVVDAATRGLNPDAAVAAFETARLAGILEAVSLTDPVVGAFDGAAHRRVVSDYADADRAHITSGPDRVRRAVAEWAVAARDAHPDESDVITRQARLKRRHLPVRQLFQAAPNVLGAMKPCWAMSPLVVAQLLPAERCFDVVIFDEASQVTPADAVGALLRAERAVVAGDTKQLPPTRFFAASAADTDEEEEDQLALTSGLESVLDVMGALLPAPKGTRTLGWHYRSRDERLIAFSNAQPSLYDWQLTTFPGVAGAECLTHELVPWRPAGPGQEDSAADEVRRVVELILDHAETRPDESLGVIAMGIKHADRISETLRRARADRPDLDEWFDHGPHDGKEPLFIKNLERVQGDERDAIILTVGYGKNAEGRMLYRFGPLNMEGGERRLNVAVTRARSRMTVVSSFASTDLDPNKLTAEGARLLGRYIAYAESGGESLGDAAKDKPLLNPFERDVRDRLTAAGIPLVAQYGCSGYWIDYAAQHPRRPGQMVLAIECDGASYHSSATARDRDRLRQEHLERLGWIFHRIWSSDWFNHREAEIERAVTAWKAAVTAADMKPAAPKPTLAAQPEPARVVAAVPKPVGRPRGARPWTPPKGTPITEHSHHRLVELVRWVESDTLLRTEDELLVAMMDELGFQKRGQRIVAALTQAIRSARNLPRSARPPGGSWPERAGSSGR